MRLLLIAVGRLKPGPFKLLQDEYAGRLAAPLLIREVEERRPLPPAELKEREGGLLLAALPKRARIVALDQRGFSLSSEDFATRLAAWRALGTGDLAFLVGGAAGLSESVRHAADFVLSLGPMTWPHFLVRGLLLEQLYRAQQINAGHPYHRAG